MIHLNDHDVYLKTDVLLLADVSEEYRHICIEYCGLNLCQYFNSLERIWDVLLKMTDIKLDFISGIDMYQFIEKCTGGGACYIAQIYNHANNKNLKSYDKHKTDKYFVYDNPK